MQQLKRLSEKEVSDGSLIFCYAGSSGFRHFCFKEKREPMKKPVFIILILLISNLVSGQERSSYRYENDFIPSDFYKGCRSELRTQMPDSSIAIFFSSPVRNRSNDTDYPFHQHPQFYYLTGFTEANSLLLIFKSPFSIAGKSTDEILFIPPRVKEREIWHGRMAAIDDAKNITGIQTVFFSPAFDTISLHATDFSKVLYLPLPSGIVDDRRDSSDLYDQVEIFKSKFSYPPSNGDSYLLSKILKRMREVKKPVEINLLEKAITISCEGHREMMKALKPGMSEYQVQAVGEYVFKNKGAEDVGYPSICGGGENSCILHYETNRKPLKEGELLLLDMAAEYHGYSADVTRTLPVNGTFSNEQKIIYQLVLKAQDSAFSQCKPGNNFQDPHHAAAEIIKKGLLNLGIIKEEEDYKTYFMHGTSHYLGLDVHDAGTGNKLSKGNVITVEPGIYIPVNSNCDPKWWNIGVRIEDDVLITANGYENLSGSCPSKVEDIEKLMQVAPSFVVPLK